MRWGTANSVANPLSRALTSKVGMASSAALRDRDRDAMAGAGAGAIAMAGAGEA